MVNWSLKEPRESFGRISDEDKPRKLDRGKHIPTHLEDTYLAFLALKIFSTVPSVNCKADPTHEKRLRNILQKLPLK